MNQSGCENEVQVLEALGRGLAPEAMEEALRQHVAGCASCSEVISIYELFQRDSEQLCADAPVPEAGGVWWRAVLAARRSAAERALRPIMIAEKAALAVGGGALMALLIFAGPSLAQQLGLSKLFNSTVVYTFPLSSLIITSVIVCALLMAGALYTLWAEE
jgi:hypothetical protein